MRPSVVLLWTGPMYTFGGIVKIRMPPRPAGGGGAVYSLHRTALVTGGVRNQAPCANGSATAEAVERRAGLLDRLLMCADG